MAPNRGAGGGVEYGVESLRAGDPAGVGPYRLLGRLGSGGMGEVFLGSREDGRLAAVKMVHTALAGDARFRVRFAREVTTAWAVGGPWVAAVLDADPAAPVPWLATEFVAGPSLDRAVEVGGPLPPGIAAVTGVRLAGALARLHARGVVHRDLKPSNVLLTAGGPRLIDFGIARALDATAITQTGTVLGPPGFMSPEQALGEEVGPAGDVFSLAAVLAYAITGRGPFGEAGNPVVLMRRVIDDEPDLAGVPDDLREPLQRCLAKAPSDRVGADELADLLAAHQGTEEGWPPPELARLMTAPPLPAVPPAPGAPGTPEARPRRPLGRRAVLTGVGGTALAGLVAAALAPRAEVVPRIEVVRPEVVPLPSPPPGTGALWTFRAIDRVSALEVAGDTVFVGAGATVTGLDAATGRQRWLHNVILDGTGRLGSEVTLSANPDVVYVSTGGSVVALDAATGQRRWATHMGYIPPYEAVVGVRVAAAEDVAYATAANRVVALDSATGQVRWTHLVARRFAGSPRAEGGRVFVTSDADIEALDRATGAPLWRRGTGAEYSSYLAVSGGLVVQTSWLLGVVCVDAATGAPRWKVDGDRVLGRNSVPVVAGGVVLMSGRDERIHALELDTGTERWARPDQAAGAGTANLTPAADGGTAFTGNSTNGRVYAFDLATGATRWRYRTGAELTGINYLAARAGTVYLAGISSPTVQAVRSA
ncbi:serine/threonine-protein kinase [Pseudonocardia acaciae]|uniref:serine/threonine-protein kinase n=1 Tax=Pseudonocardia acaciae TaxID=551276 RepID=UPI000688B76C|nr:serine/threonine-protein kinase [Pseudonocardia acaciae]